MEGARTKKVLIVSAAAIITVACITLPLSYDYYIKVDTDRIVLDDFWGFGQRQYSFDDVSDLWRVTSRKNDKGEAARRKYHEIHFADGHVLSFDNDNYSVNWDRQVEIMEFISEKSGREIKLRDPYPNIPQ